jgi:hypothetical protein
MNSQQTGDILDRIAHGAARIFERIPRVLDNPLGYAQEAFVLAAMVAVIAIVVLLIALLAIENRPARLARRSLGYRRRPERTALRAGVLLGAVLASVFAVSLLPLVPAVGSACGACHGLAPAVEAWETDPHRGVSCYGCHARRGVVGAVQAGAEGASRLLDRRGTSGVQAPVFEQRCLRCHDEIGSGVTGGDVRMRHSDVIAAGYPCLGCHPYVGHATLERSPLPVTRSRMSTCLGCHDGVSAPSSCVVCHDSRPSDTILASSPGTTRAPVTCEGCHSDELDRTCVECHGLVLPHPPEFGGEHARLSWRDPGLCARCHEAAIGRNGCDCHGDVNVHGTYNEWFPRHGPAARAAWPGGCRCHRDSFCLMCHERIP